MMNCGSTSTTTSFALRQLSLALSLGGGLLAAPGAHAAATLAPGLANCSDAGITQLLDHAPQVKVVATRTFHKGQPLSLQPQASAPRVERDLCMVKLQVGPGTPGPSGAPSTQAGIGIELWLPAPQAWNGRIHNVGGGGFMGAPSITATDQLAQGFSGIAPVSQIANAEGAVSAVTDTGHTTPGQAPPALNGSFLMLPSGAVNTVQWADFSERGIHETTVLTKRLTAAFYGAPARHAYFEGCSTGGRQAHKYAQSFPQDYDGILAGAPAINWTRFITAELYPQVAMQQDGGGPISPAQLNHVSAAAISACDTMLNGQHLGYIADPATCRYNPAKDKTVLCTSSGGTDTSGACVSLAQARTVNKIWFGQTRDGSVPDPARTTGYGAGLADQQLWFGVTRGTSLPRGLANSRDGVALPFPIAANQVALNLHDASLATANFTNATGNGQDNWKKLTYADLARAYDQGIAQQQAFARINTDNPDLSAFRDRGGKMMVYHGTSDNVIPLSGTLHYFDALVRHEGGLSQADQFYRLYTVPAMGHCEGVGSADGIPGVSPAAAPPLPVKGQLYQQLVSWVEHQQPPGRIMLANTDKTVEHPLCKFPSMLHYKGGNVNAGASYDCR